ncbi:MAG: polysaccharide deacetylase [Actinomycetota bacterium]
MDRLSVCLTFDFDAMAPWLKTNNPSAISRGEFGAVAVPRILDMLRAYGAHATFFVPGHTALAYPDLIERIRDEGHELGHHGWMHENPAQLDEDAERYAFERGIECLEKVSGLRPYGWRSPAWDMSPRSIDLLLDYEFRYDSSLMGNDFTPYFVRRGDRWSNDGPYEFGEPTPIVELPVYWGLDDFPAFEFVAGRNGGLASPSGVREIWQGDFDFAYERCEGGVFTLTMHPQTIGRGHRFAMLESLVSYIAQKPGVRFEAMGAVAEAWRASQ